MKVKIIKRKPNKKGMCSMYIEIYKGYTKDKAGKIKHNREYKPLNLQVYNNPKTPIQKNHNKDIYQIAEAVKSKITIDIKNNLHDFKSKPKTKTFFFDYFEYLIELRNDSKGNKGNWIGTLKHLKKYCTNHSITFEHIDKDFIEGFKEHLKHKAKTINGKPLAVNTTASYFNKLRACINTAFEDNIINRNPLKGIKGIKGENPIREYLTLEEIKKLVNFDCRYQVLKDAFLFSCLTGLRWSDIQNLRWGQVIDESDGTRIVFHQQKTKGLEYLDLSNQAVNILGERGDNEDRVFVGLKYSAYHNTALSRWMLKAGITKQITFHCARHSYAVMQISMGTDIFTLSKLLGHTELRTTQIYAKVSDKAKKEAINRIPDINL